MVAFFPISLLLFLCCWLVEGDHDVVITGLEEIDDCERRTKSGDRVYVRYTGSIDETSTTGKPNTVFDSNMSKKSPLEFYIGNYFTIVVIIPLRSLCTCVRSSR